MPLDVLTQIFAFGKEIGAPLAVILFVIILVWLLIIFKNLADKAIEVLVKFTDRHFAHIDSLEKEVQENSKTNTANSEKLATTLSTVNASITALTAYANQTTQKLEPLGTALVRLEQVMKQCEKNQ